MDKSLVSVYLVILLILLGVVSLFILRQVFRTRRSESALSRLQKQLSQSKGTTQEHFELGSIYLSKKLPTQALVQFQQALKTAEAERDAQQDPDQKTEQQTNLAPIYNAMGYAYFAQEQFDLAIRHYKDALKLKPNYVTALNNLGHAYERKNLAPQALDAYEQALQQEPQNSTAKKRATSLRKRVAIA